MKIKRKCEICGNELNKDQKRFCSRKCYGKWYSENRGGFGNCRYSKIAMVCYYCAKIFFSKPSECRKYCSRECFGKHNTEFRSGKNSQFWNRIKKICKECGKEYYIQPYLDKNGKRKFCSRKCKEQWQSKNTRGKNHPYWKGGEVIKYCIMCGKKFTMPKCWIKRGRGFFCSQKCLAQWRSENKSGENSWSWRGGLSFEPYGVEFNSKLKKRIRKRDNYTCQQCGYTEEQLKRKLDIHHINYNKLDNEPENLISLCRSCHLQTNYRREDWTKYFQDKGIH